MRNSVARMWLLIVIVVGVAGLLSLVVVRGDSSTLTATTATTVFTSSSVTLTLTSNSLASGTTSATVTQGTMTFWVSTTSIVISTEIVTTSTTEMQSTATVTSTLTEPLMILTSYPGLLLVGLAAAAAVASATYRKWPRGRSMTCADCGYQNPPFTGPYCTNCGKPLRK